MSSAEAKAREAVDRFEAALDRQWDAVEARSWTRAPKHIREAHGDPSLPDPPTREAMDAWTALLLRKMNSLRLCRENLEKGQDAVRGDPARVEIYWKRAISTAERGLAELDDFPDRAETETVELEDVPDDVIAGYLALLEEYRGRQVVDDSVLPAPAARLRAALERGYQRSPDQALAEGLIALPVFVPPEDVDAVERYLLRRTGEVGAIGRATWDRGVTVVRRIAGEQRVTMRRLLGPVPSAAGVASPIPVLGGVAASRTAAAEMAAAAPELATYNASLAWDLAAYGASGLGTLIVLGVGGFLLGEHVGALVLTQGVLLVIGFLPALEVMHRVLGRLVRRAVKAGKAPESTDSVSVVLPFVPPVVIGVVTWLIVTSE